MVNTLVLNSILIGVFLCFKLVCSVSLTGSFGLLSFIFNDAVLTLNPGPMFLKGFHANN